MAAKVAKVDVWVAKMQDKPGALNEKLAAVSRAGGDLEFVVARRAPDMPGTSVVFLAPLKGKKQVGAAESSGFTKATTMHSLRAEGPDRPGVGTQMTAALAKAGINLRGLSAASIKKKYVCYFAFDTPEDAKAALSVIKKSLGGKKK